MKVNIKVFKVFKIEGNAGYLQKCARTIFGIRNNSTGWFCFNSCGRIILCLETGKYINQKVILQIVLIP